MLADFSWSAASMPSAQFSVGWTPTVPSHVAQRIDGACSAHGHLRLCVIAVGFLDFVSSSLRSARHRPCRHTSLHRRCGRTHGLPQAPCARCRLPRRRQLRFTVGWTPIVRSHVAASTVCAAHTDTACTVRSLSASKAPSAQCSVGWTPTVLSHVAASTVCVAHTNTCRLRVLAVGCLDAASSGLRSAGRRPCRHTSLHRWCVCGAPGHLRLRLLAVGCLDTASSSFRSAGHRPCGHTSLHRRCVRRTRTLQAPCARCRLPRRRQRSISVGWTPTVPSHDTASTVCAAHTDTSGCVCSLSACTTPPAQYFGRLDTDRAVTRRCIDGVCGAHGHFRLRVLAVGCLDAASAVFRSAGHRPCRHTSLHRRCLRRSRTLQAPCARCRLPRRRQLSISVGWTSTVPSHAAASTVCVAHTDTSGSVCSLSASSTPPAQHSRRLDTDRAVTRRCIDGVCGAH